MDYINKLQDFHVGMYKKTKDDRSYPNQKFIPNNDTAQLRAALILEEANELAEALKLGTLSDVRKELCDLLYVTFGTAVVYQLDDYDFSIVHDNNMLKLDTATVGDNGKLIKAKDHPKVIFKE